MIEDWDAGRRSEVDLEEAACLEREIFAAEMLKLMKEPTWGFSVSVPCCALAGVAIPRLITACAKRFGVPLERSKTTGSRSGRACSWTPSSRLAMT